MLVLCSPKGSDIHGELETQPKGLLLLFCAMRSHFLQAAKRRARVRAIRHLCGNRSVVLHLTHLPGDEVSCAPHPLSRASCLLSPSRRYPLPRIAACQVMDPQRPDVVDLRDIKVLKKLGGTVSEAERHRAS